MLPSPSGPIKALTQLDHDRLHPAAARALSLEARNVAARSRSHVGGGVRVADRVVKAREHLSSGRDVTAAITGTPSLAYAKKQRAAARARP